MKILVTDSSGQLESELKELVQNLKFKIQNYIFVFTDIKLLDITNHEAIEKFIKDNYIKVIINCAAYTAINKAEFDMEMAYKINHLAVVNMARIAKNYYNIKLIYTYI